MNFLFSGYVLAGGKSSRMGRDKAFLKIQEKTFVENAVGVLKPNCVEVKIVLNKSRSHFLEKLPINVSYIFDTYVNRGALGGIHAAFEDCKTEYAVILAVDLPFVTSGAIRKFCEIIQSDENASAAVPRQTDGKLQPLCAVYRVSDCLPKAREILSKPESVSMRDFLETVNVKITETNVLATNQDLFLNVNNSDDLKKINLNDYEN